MVQTGNLKELAYESMLDKIHAHALVYGQVYSERQISAEIGVSRTPFHSALLQLEKEGYIDVLPSRGFMLHQLSRKDVRQTFEVRAAVEFYCCSRIMQDLAAGMQDVSEEAESLAEHAHQPSSTSQSAATLQAQNVHGEQDSQGQQDIQSLMATLDESLRQQAEIAAGSRDRAAYEAYDVAFHQAIVSYVGNPEFDRLFASYMFWIESLAIQSLRHEHRMEDALDEHRHILEAIRANNTGALYRACQEHFTVPQALNLEDLDAGRTNG